MSAKGLFSFDAYDLGCRPTNYFNVASPIEPITLQSLPSRIQSILETTGFHSLDFSIDKDISHQLLSGRDAQ